ncbi:hypothetical protein SSX86_022424 [Deinandra increscens subsp. villosa]|uniref:DOG1 domain-containing protein n=1 Tax=Deinandra increscens subsp. villosa TaxID=3103831 RepID=A0AAP0CMK5_9ASTR
MTEHKNTPPQIFQRFFNRWLDELDTQLQQLVSAANHHRDYDNSVNLRQLIDKSVRQYAEFYTMKSVAAKGDVISVFSPVWLTSLEDTFLWIAGWRPTTAIHLLYSKAGIQFETKLEDLAPVFASSDLGDLSFNQISLVDKLHKKTIREERKITEKMAKLQESAADRPMVGLSNAVSDMMRNEDGDGGEESDRKVESTMEPKKDALEKLLNMADDLRMETLRGVIEILTPIQAVYFLIAAAELHLRLHDWGLKKDAE